MKEHITVTNTGKRMRYRAGHKFRPGATENVDVTPSGRRAIAATIDLQIVTDTPTGNSTGPHLHIDTTGTGDNVEQLDVGGLSVAAVLEAVEAGTIGADWAFDQEQAGKARVSLLDALQKVIDADAEADNTEDGDDNTDQGDND